MFDSTIDELQAQQNLAKNLESPIAQLMFKKHYMITWRIFSSIIGTIVLLGGGGYMLDKYLETKPIFMIIGLVLAFPVSIAVIIKITKNLINKAENGKHS